MLAKTSDTNILPTAPDTTLLPNAPDNWLRTPEVQLWLRQRDFPYDSVHNMVNYIQQHFGTHSLVRMVDESFPQSYAHWWCHCRMARLQSSETYATLHRWQRLVSKHTGEAATIAIVLAHMYQWLDLLSLDRLLFTDETYRENVPRCRLGGALVLTNQPPLATRADTVHYIIEQGALLFSERGWTDGCNYWRQNCRKYQI